LQQAFERGASDIHLEARREELAVRFRVDGALHGHSRLPASWGRPVIACLKALAHIDAGSDGGHEQPPSPAAREGSIPFVFKKQNYEVRISTLPGAHGESAVLHVSGGKRVPRDLEHLGLAPEQLARLEPILAARGGLVFVAGPAGSGRTTTLDAILARLATPDRKVIALVERAQHELDGVLYVRGSDQSGCDHAARVRALLGQDPDLLVVPEFDGRGLARSLLEAALTGRSVLASQRARSALEALTRLVHFGLEPYLLADALRGVVAQRLVRRICASCKTPMVPDEVLVTRLGLPRDGATYFEGEGCEACHGTGFSERLALFEVLSATPGLRRELEKGSSLEALTQAARAEGFTSLREHGLGQARAGSTTLHEVLVATAEG
jgi:type II secretory ATPase GspE/PulE/Tfp pilus assembly ATPase PilB-like protein